MVIAVVAESLEGERRVAMVPDLVPRFVKLGYDVVVEPGAGRFAGFSDDDYYEAGASIDPDAIVEADIVLSVQPLWPDLLEKVRPGTTTISYLAPSQMVENIAWRRDLGVNSFAVELIPRISRAQSMDVLSSQALVAGYRCGVVAAGALRRFFPLSMTAAGTVKPAQVVVLGAGVAGLQAIATCKRLGAVVKAYDVRAAAAEEIASMGAVPIDLELDTLEGTGGYAREMTEDRAARQRERLAPYIADADALITTAAVPGREAPLLVTSDMVEQMRPGSVVVDLAAESGGNVEGSEPGAVVRIGAAQVWGMANAPSAMPEPASRLYAQNLLNLLTLMTDDGSFAPDFDDEVVAGCCVTYDGRIMHGPTREVADGPDDDVQGVEDVADDVSEVSGVAPADFNGFDADSSSDDETTFEFDDHDITDTPPPSAAGPEEDSR